MKRVLIVDDSQTTRIRIKNFLGDEYVSEEAENGVVAMELLSEDNNFDLIVLDINMPELDGMSFVQLQAENERINKIPTILCTTEASVQMKEKAKKTGVVKAWVIKPIIKKVLLGAIERVLENFKK